MAIYKASPRKMKEYTWTPEDKKWCRITLTEKQDGAKLSIQDTLRPGSCEETNLTLTEMSSIIWAMSAIIIKKF